MKQKPQLTPNFWTNLRLRPGPYLLVAMSGVVLVGVISSLVWLGTRDNTSTDDVGNPFPATGWTGAEGRDSSMTLEAFREKVETHFEFASGEIFAPDTLAMGRRKEVTLHSEGYGSTMRITLNERYNARAEIKLYNDRSRLVFRDQKVNAFEGTTFVIRHQGLKRGRYTLVVRNDRSQFKENIFIY